MADIHDQWYLYINNLSPLDHNTSQDNLNQIVSHILQSLEVVTYNDPRRQVAQQYLERAKYILDLNIEEPEQVKIRGRPSGSQNKRDLSLFKRVEMAECSKIRCGSCGGIATGHNSKTCPFKFA
jgi:hypothetical protein